MPDEKARVGFSLDFKDSKTQIDALIKALQKVKSGFKETGKEGEASLNRLNVGMKSVFQNVSALSSNLRRGIESGQKMSRKQLSETLSQAKTLESRVLKIHEKTVQRYTQAEGVKRKSIKSTMQAQEQALNQLKRISKTTQESLEKQRAGYGALASILSVKVSSVLRNLIEESTLLAARNEVLGTAMRTVGNNAGISNAELERTEMTVRKLGISINDTRELISRFSQAQLGMDNATRLARAAQDLAAGSTLGSSEALRTMTQSILSLLPRQLRQFGVVVNLNQVYQEQSRILGKSVNSLTSLEKRQGLLNKIFEEAAKRAGAYERSMEDSGKVLTTLSSRIIPDTLSMLGQEFLPVLEKLVFGFKDLLEWVQAQEGGFKTLVATLLAVGAAITTVVGAFTLFSGIVGAATGGFTGFAAAAGSTLATMGPLAIAIGAVGAALVLIPKLFEETATAQEKALESSQGLLNIELDRVGKLEDLQQVLQDQSLTEEELRKVIEGNVKAHKELIPFLNKEKVTREELLGVIDQELIKSKEVLKIAKERAKLAGEEQLKALQEQQKQTNSLVTALDKLQKKYGEGKVPVLVLAGALRVFQNKVEDAGGSIDKVGNQMREFADENDGGMQNLIRSSQKLGGQIRTLKQDIDTGFGTAAKETVQSASDMQQAFLGIEAEYDKLTKKLAKKFPFKALADEETERLESISKALNDALITEEQATEARLKIQKVFQEKRQVAELKFREKLDSIGQSALQKIEARRARLLEVNQGSAVAIEAIEREAVVGRNVIFEKMWSDRIGIVKGSVESIGATLKTAHDFRINQLKQGAAIALAEENISADQRIEVKKQLHDDSLRLLSLFQDEESSLREQHFAAMEGQTQELFNKGIIDEMTYNERTAELQRERVAFEKGQHSVRLENLKTMLNDMYQEEVSINKKIKDLDKDKVDSLKTTNDTVRKLEQEGQTDSEIFLGDRKRAEELLYEGRDALRKGDLAGVKAVDAEIRQIAQATSKEVRESDKKDADVLITAAKARKGAIELVKDAGRLLQDAFVSQRQNEEEALSNVKDEINNVEMAVKSLQDLVKDLEIKVKDSASEVILSVKNKLDSLKDKTVTVTVVTNNVTAGGGGPAVTGGGVPAGGGEETPALAAGAVDIKGPGTSTSDSIVAMLSRGESVLNATATRMFGPMLELMNTNPESLRNILTPRVNAGGISGGGDTNVSDSTEVGAVNITINGIDSKDVQNINWRKAVREQIAPELNKLSKRKASI